MEKPFAPSAERNREPILDELRRELKQELAGTPLVLEIGSGTGQHACFFGAALPGVTWQPTELHENLPGIRMWLDECALGNVRDPLALDVDIHPWPEVHADVCFTCNTFHIVSEDSVRSIFKGAKAVLGRSGKLCVYGPFTVDGEHTSSGNRDFDQWLKESNPVSGVRDVTELDSQAARHGFSACRRIEMPANNQLLVWKLEVSDA